jgi:hypothetical protein
LKEKHFAKSAAMLPMDILPVMLVCLQQAAAQIALHPEIKEAIGIMVSQAQPVLARNRQLGAPGAPPMPPPSQQQQQQPPPPQLRPTVANQPPPPSVSGSSQFPSVGGPVRPTPRQALPPNLVAQAAAAAAAAAATGILPSDPFINQFGNLGLGTSAAAAPTSSSSAFSLPALGPLVSSGAGSPNRMFGNIPSVPPPVGPPPPTSVDGGSPSPFGGGGVLLPSMPPPPPPPQLQGLPSSQPPPQANQGMPPVSTSAGTGGIQSGIEQIRQGNIAQIFPDMAGPIPREVEDEANRYFQQERDSPNFEDFGILEFWNFNRFLCFL